MCGIFLALGSLTYSDCSGCVKTLTARGPEGSSARSFKGGHLAFTRLAINGLSPKGMQPMELSNTIFATNGEIYNWRELQDTYGFNCQTGSDCEIIGQLYMAFSEGPLSDLKGLFQSLDGVFATAIVDQAKGRVILARDPFGVRPLYKGYRNVYTKDRIMESQIFFGSELKSVSDLCQSVEHFPPGMFEVYDLSTRALLYSAVYHPLVLSKMPALHSVEAASNAVRLTLEAAIKKRMMTERPCAALLSGGLDSSLVASLAAKALREAGAPPLKTFSIGMKGSSDLFYAEKVAKWIGSDHTQIVLTEEDFFQVIPDVIYAVESYDTTTIRASVGNWLVSKHVALTDCKVVFNGDGADELFGSYLYMFGAPDAKSYESEVLRLLKDIHMFDVLRSDRSISSHGLEPRTPFLDKTFVQTILQIPLEFRRPTATQPEKWLLRRAFDDGLTLPRDVLWRRKEAFSDGVSGTERPWYKAAQEMSKHILSSWSSPTHLPPTTAEMAHYRTLFDAAYPGMSNVVPYFWMPRWSDSVDPSAKTLSNY
jgi:asparagine synthase (glutamine-hydrolysing)